MRVSISFNFDCSRVCVRISKYHYSLEPSGNNHFFQQYVLDHLTFSAGFMHEEVFFLPYRYESSCIHLFLDFKGSSGKSTYCCCYAATILMFLKPLAGHWKSFLEHMARALTEPWPSVHLSFVLWHSLWNVPRNVLQRMTI